MGCAVDQLLTSREWTAVCNLQNSPESIESQSHVLKRFSKTFTLPNRDRPDIFRKSECEMLGIQEVAAVMESLPCDFVLKVGDVDFQFNRSVLGSLATVIGSLDPQIRLFVLPVEVSQEAAEQIYLFVRGKVADFVLDPFDCLVYGASIGMSCVLHRVSDHVRTTTTFENFEVRFERIRSFPGFLSPLAAFIAEHPQYFKAFVQGKRFPAEIISIFLSYLELFQTEDEKARFILEHTEGDPDSFLFDTLNLADISEPILYQLISDDKISHSFSVMAKFIKVRKTLEAESSILVASMAETQAIFDSVLAECTDRKRMNETLWEKLYYRRCMMADIEGSLKLQEGEVGSILAKVGEMRHANETYIVLGEKLQDLGDEVGKLLQAINKVHVWGRFAFHNTSPAALRHCGEWSDTVQEMLKDLNDIVIPGEIFESAVTFFGGIVDHIDALFEK
jgi:hypothetical protein